MKSLGVLFVICAFVATTAYGEDPSLNEIGTDDIITKAKVDTKPKKVYSGFSGEIEDRGRLISYLFSGYDKRNYPTNMTVQFGVALLSFDIDEERHTFEADTWLRMKWNDNRLRWDKKDFNVDVIRMVPDEVWHPDTTLYNSVDLPEMMKCWSSNMLIYPNGDVLWVPPCHLSAYCNHTLWKDPFGPQLCTLKFGSWTFDGISMGLEFYNKEAKADVSDFRGTPHWELVANEAKRTEKYYDCCTEPYLDLTYNITIQRRQTPLATCRI